MIRSAVLVPYFPQRFLFFVLLVFVIVSVPVYSQTYNPNKQEVRAVWLTIIGGADWPRTHDVEKQKQSLIDIFETLSTRNFNTVFFQVRARGDALYQSSYEPWAAELTGTLGDNPGWDPLEFAIREAHKRGMELHAWINVAKVYSNGTPSASTPLHIVKKHPSWVQQYDKEWWLDMGIPDARRYLEDVVMEIVRMYNIDGIHFDYVRYPGEKFNDWSSYRTESDGAERAEWRRNNITTFVREMYKKITSEKPMMKVGSAPIGIYESIAGAQSGFAGYSTLYQDARKWMEEKIHDYIAPQLYWDFGEQSFPNDPDFRMLCIDWARNTYGRHIYIGIGAYRASIQKELWEQVGFSRKVKVQGQAFFRYSNIVSTTFGYKYPALIPPMAWKDSIPPYPPRNVTITIDENGSRVLQWTAPPPAQDDDLPKYYVVYRSMTKPVDTNNPRNLIAIVPAPETSFADKTGYAASSFYAVTSLDKGNNESKPDDGSVVPKRNGDGIPINQIAILRQNEPNPFIERTYISYEVAESSMVQLVLSDIQLDMDITLVQGFKKPGKYVVALDGKKLPAGKYMYELRVGSFVDVKFMERKPE
jgi:uncharacterized lipoprotein YddW (UPF0748 family)